MKGKTRKISGTKRLEDSGNSASLLFEPIFGHIAPDHKPLPFAVLGVVPGYPLVVTSLALAVLGIESSTQPRIEREAVVAAE